MTFDDLLRYVTNVADRLGLAYVIVGSVASSNFGDPRLTLDIDMLVDLKPSHIDAFVEAFPSPEFYLSRRAVESAVQKQFQFNILHPTSGLKVDCFVAGDVAYSAVQLQRAVVRPQLPEGFAVRLAAPEDVIVKKLEYFKLGESEKHIRDIGGILRVQGERIDRNYIRHWAQELGLEEIWDAVLVRLEAP